MDNKTIAELLSPEIIKNLAIPSNYRYGKAIYERGAVEFITREPQKVEGWAGGLDGTVAEGAGQRRRVQFFATPEGLTWHCAGNPKDHQIFCKHCVALALAILDHTAQLSPD